MQVPVPREEWIPVTVPAIVGRSVFTLAQKRLGLSKEQASRNARREYLLGRRLKCLQCGYTLTGRTRREKHQYYYCNGREKKPGTKCSLPQVRCDQLDAAVWAWLKNTMQHPEQLAEGLRGERAAAERENRALRDRLELVVAGQGETARQLGELLNLFLEGRFPKALLATRQAELEKQAADLERERADLQEHLSSEVWTDDKITAVEEAVREIADGLENATFADKRRYFDLLDVRATYGLEDGARVVYVKCRLGKQRLQVVPTSPL
jgi:site-specific DNA recombinase